LAAADSAVGVEAGAAVDLAVVEEEAASVVSEDLVAVVDLAEAALAAVGEMPSLRSDSWLR
jgi:hypothetical protein